MKANFNTLKVTLSVIGISLCILTTSLSFVTDSKTSDLNTQSASHYKMMDDNNPEKA